MSASRAVPIKPVVEGRVACEVLRRLMLLQAHEFTAMIWGTWFSISVTSITAHTPLLGYGWTVPDAGRARTGGRFLTSYWPALTLDT
jgi:hypothetical protein